MPALERLDAACLRHAVEAYRDALRQHREELNRLNVYPVPDGDTGTNMVLTMESVLHELDGTQTVDEVCEGLAHGSLMGARGNSGVILSQILRGMAETFRGCDGVDGGRVARALGQAAAAAYEAVMRPVEGTILTVVRESAEAVAAMQSDGTNLLGVLEASRGAAEQSLALTPDLLPVLKAAGVVDAGAKGYVLLLDALLHVADGRPVPAPEVFEAPEAVRAHLEGEVAPTDLRYEVMFLLEADDESVPHMKEAWAAVGDSIVVVGGEGLWNCHIHTNEIGAAIEAGIQAGRPRNVQVTDLVEQVEEEAWVRERTGAVATEAVPAEPVTTAVVAVAVGPGLQRLFTGLGASRVVAGGQTMNPSTRQIAEAVEACPANSVVILPNNKNIIPVASRVCELTNKKVEVVATTSVIEGLSGLVAYDPEADLGANVAAINEGATRVKTGEVTQAVRDATSELGAISQGDWIALDRHGLRAVATSPVDAALALVDDLVDDDDELLTIVVGTDADTADTAHLQEQVALAHPELEVEVHEGGQPLYPYLLGVE